MRVKNEEHDHATSNHIVLQEYVPIDPITIKNEERGRLEVAQQHQMWLSGFKYGFFAQKVSREFRVFPLDFYWKFNPAHFCHPFLRKRPPKKVFKK